jgi:hypothetical protein
MIDSEQGNQVAQSVRVEILFPITSSAAKIVVFSFMIDTIRRRHQQLQLWMFYFTY